MKTTTVMALLAATMLMGTPALANHMGHAMADCCEKQMDCCKTEKADCCDKGHKKGKETCDMMLGKDGKPMKHHGGKPDCPMMKGMHHGGHGGHAMEVKGDTGASSEAFRAANEVMHRDMNINFSGDADIDFLRGMIPHHQGAIDMAEVVLEHGTDPQAKRLAREIIRAQNAEIHFMKVRLEQLEKNRGVVHEHVNSRAANGQHGKFHDQKWAGETWMGQE